ncbi:MAG: hypothetical protein AAF821_00120 [Cyanobacteria bacterium P01_D01_bin.156]
MKTKIIEWIGGEKGGCGKSFFCRSLAQYFDDHGIRYTLFDTDRANPDLGRIYRDRGCRFAVLSEAEKHEDSPNAIFNAASTGRVLVNLPAQSFVPLKTWIEGRDVFDLAQDESIVFRFWFVTDGGFDSIKLLRQTLEYFGDKVSHVLVRNVGRGGDDWSHFDQDEQLQALLKQCQVSIVDLPRYPSNRHRNIVDSDSMTFGQARKHQGEYGAFFRQSARKFLRDTYAALEQSGILSAEVDSDDSAA